MSYVIAYVFTKVFIIISFLYRTLKTPDTKIPFTHSYRECIRLRRWAVGRGFQNNGSKLWAYISFYVIAYGVNIHFEKFSVTVIAGYISCGHGNILQFHIGYMVLMKYFTDENFLFFSVRYYQKYTSDSPCAIFQSLNSKYKKLKISKKKN